MNLEQRKAKAEALKGREVRRCPVDGLEIRNAGDGTVSLTGWASVTERSYDMGFYTETIRQGAFARTLRENPDVQLLVNHEGLPLARTIGGSLRLSEDDTGLRVEADLDPADPDVQRLTPKVQRGLIDQMSFAFSGARSEWDDEFTQRSIIDLSIHRGDVSIVNQGANPATSFQFNSADGLEWLRGLPDDEARSLFLARFPASRPADPVHDLDLYRARAHALAQRARTL